MQTFLPFMYTDILFYFTFSLSNTRARALILNFHLYVHTSIYKSSSGRWCKRDAAIPVNFTISTDSLGIIKRADIALCRTNNDCCLYFLLFAAWTMFIAHLESSSSFWCIAFTLLTLSWGLHWWSNCCLMLISPCETIMMCFCVWVNYWNKTFISSNNTHYVFNICTLKSRIICLNIMKE